MLPSGWRILHWFLEARSPFRPGFFGTLLEYIMSEPTEGRLFSHRIVGTHVGDK